MSNICGQTRGVESGGQSVFWDNGGNLIANLNETDPGLLIVEKFADKWTGKALYQ
jgi:hypothetical protein